MNKRLTRILSMLLVLVMFVSVGVPGLAEGTISRVGTVGDENAAGGGSGDLPQDWDREIDENEIAPFEDEVIDEEGEDPTLSFEAEDKELGYTVTVNAPQSALPALAELRVKPVEIEDIREAVESVVEGEPQILIALDISFWMDDEEIEPEEPVQVVITAPELEGKRNLTLVHVPEEEEPETIDLIDDEDLAFSLGTNEIAFQSKDFSVYAVIEGDPTNPATKSIRYEFYTDNSCTTPYNFVNKEGTETYYQVVGEGETLVSPGTPVSLNDDDKEFAGWFEQNAADTAEPILAPGADGLLIEGIEASATVKLYPRFAVPYYIEYHDEKGLIYRTESTFYGNFTLDANRTASLLDSDNELRISYQPDNENNAFLGWAVYGEGKTSYEESDVVTSVTFAEGQNKIVLVPVNATVVWVNFNKNDDDTSRATYTAPLYLLNGEKVSQRYPNKFTNGYNGLPKPTRAGYVFAGWYLDEEFQTEFTKDTVVTANITVTAKWTPGPATYTIIYWKQDADNEVDLPDELPEGAPADAKVKTFSYAGSRTVNSTTGTPVALTNDDLNYLLETGFEVNENLTTEGYWRVKPDNSTVLNVYYDRKVYTLTFQVQGEGYQYVVDNNATTGNIYGLMPDGSFQKLRVDTTGTEEADAYEVVSNFTAGEDYLIVYDRGSSYSPRYYVLSNVYYDTSNNYQPRLLGVRFSTNAQNTSYYDANLTDTTYGDDVSEFLLEAGGSSGYWTLHNDGMGYLSDVNAYPSFSTDYLEAKSQWNWSSSKLTNRSNYTYKYLRVYSSSSNFYVDTANSTTNQSSFILLRRVSVSVTAPKFYYTDTNGVEQEYLGDRYVYRYNNNADAWRNVKQFRALYGHSVHDTFPVVGYDGTDYSSYRWSDYVNTTQGYAYYKYVLQTLDIMPNVDVVFHGAESKKYKTIYYYVEALPDDVATADSPIITRTVDGQSVRFKLQKTVEHNFNFITYDEEYHPLVGFTRNPSICEPAFGETYYWHDSTGWSPENDEKIAPIPHYAWDPQYNNSYAYQSGVFYYYYNDAGQLTGVTDSTAPNYKNIWVNYLFYTRNSDNLEFYDAFDKDPILINGEELKVSYKYEQKLSDAQNLFTVSEDKSTITYNGVSISHEGYEFTGWYLDEAATTPFDFNDTMPNGPLRIYAGWKLLRYRVWLNPQGGEFNHVAYGEGDDAGWQFTESTYFRTNWGSLIQKYDDVQENGRNYYQDDNVQGNDYYVYVYLCDVSKDSARAAYYKHVSELTTLKIYNEKGYYDVINEADYTDGHKYVRQDGVYSFVGWYYAPDLDLSNDNVPPTLHENDRLEPWDFNIPVTEKLAIRAVWKRQGTFEVRYDANMYDVNGNVIVPAATGTVVPDVSDFTYGDLATTITGHAPTVIPENYVFVGWKTPIGEIKQHNDIFTIYSNYATKQENFSADQPAYYYDLTAVYRRIDVTTLTYNANGGTGTLTDLNNTQPSNTEIEIDTANNQVNNILLNSVVTLSTGAGFTRSGYRLLGWNDDQAAANRKEVKFELGGTYGVGAESVENGNTLYAVWGDPIFYIYHSGNNTVERVTSTAGAAYDLSAKTASTFLYGGYYSNYAGKSTDFDVTQIADTAWVNNVYTDEDGTPYVGAAGVWVRAEAYEAHGNAIIPEDGTVYYLKEVPDSKYLQPYFHYTYYLNGNTNPAHPGGTIGGAWLISAIDDMNYGETGFVISDANDKAEKIATSLTIKTSNGGNSVTLNSNRLFGAAGYLDYLTVIKDSNPVTATNFSAGAKVLQYWVTPDGLIVTGTTKREYVNISNQSNFDRDHYAQNVIVTPVESTIEVFNPAGNG